MNPDHFSTHSDTRFSQLGRVRPPPRLGTSRLAVRILISSQPGFYVMRLNSGAPLVPAIIYQLCPMVIPQPTQGHDMAARRRAPSVSLHGYGSPRPQRSTAVNSARPAERSASTTIASP